VNKSSSNDYSVIAEKSRKHQTDSILRAPSKPAKLLSPEDVVEKKTIKPPTHISKTKLLEQVVADLSSQGLLKLQYNYESPSVKVPGVSPRYYI